MKLSNIIYIFFIIYFFNVFKINSQLLPVTNNSLIIVDDGGNQPVSKYPSASNSATCSFTYNFYITTNELDATITGVSSQGPLGYYIDLLSQNNKAYVISNVVYVPVGISNWANIEITSSLSSVKYNLTLTCKEIDITKVKLNFVNNKVMNFFNNYISFLKFEYQDDPNLSIQLYSNSMEYGAIGILNSDLIPVVWNDKIFAKNGFNVLDNWTISIDFGNSRFINVTTNSYHSQFLLDELPFLPYQINYYPSYVNNSGNAFNLLQKSCGPIIEFKVKTNIFRPIEMLQSYSDVFITRAISGTKGDMTYIQSFPIGINGQKSSYLIFQQDNFTMSISDVNTTIIDKEIPRLIFTNDFTIFELIIQNLILSHLPNVDYKGTSLVYSYASVSIKKSWPFGFVAGNNLNFNNSIILTKSLYNNNDIDFNTFSVRTFDTMGDTLSKQVSYSQGDNFEKPKLVSYEFHRFSNSSYILRVQIKSYNGVKSITFGEITLRGLETLIYGDTFNGIYEFIFDMVQPVTLFVYDIYGNLGTFSNDYLISVDPLVKFQFPPQLPYNVKVEELDNLSFLYNNLDISDGKDHYNVITLNSSTIPPDALLGFLLGDQVSMFNTQIFLDKYSPFKYDQVEKVFKCPFIIPKNTEFGELPFVIIYNFGSVAFSSSFSTSLIVNNSYVDIQGPLISAIEKIGDSMIVKSQSSIGWRVTITDDRNGFKYGIFKVIGSIDSSTYYFNISLKDAIAGGNKLSSKYDLLINVNTPCISQTYSIISVTLYDTNNIISTFESFEISKDPLLSPFIKLYDNGVSFLNISYTCENSINDQSLSTLLTFEASKTSVDVGSIDRSIDFQFSISQSNFGMKQDQLPIIYIISERMDMVECVSQLVNPSNTGNLQYNCTIQLPISFGYPGNLLFSVYGFVNNGGYYFGYTTQDLISKGFSWSANTTQSFLPIISSNLRYISTENELFIIGRCLGNTSNVEFDNLSGQKVLISPIEIIGESVVKLIIKPTSTPFNIKIITSTSSSNIYTVYPIYFSLGPDPTETPTETPTPTVSDTPQTCPGNPVCGGTNNGYCSSSGLCVCNSPWVGSTCTSQVIIVPQPSTNTSEPSTSIPTDPIDGSSGENNGHSNIFFRSLISLVSLRELDYNSNQVVNHIFDKWIYTPITELKNQYETSVNQGTTNITATLEWFNKTSTIEFANNQLIMYPSSIKYTIEISHYQFSNSLNSLQLIMSALFESSKSNDICSSEEFGNISSDDHNSNDNYLKIQIENKSLFGRFIKRGLIDNKVKSISNQLLDSSFNNIKSSSSSVQAYVAITIPNYQLSAIIDPDFSILVDSNKASSSSQNSICTSSSSKLSKGQLAGIIVGSVAFAVSIVIVVVYMIIKNKQKKQFLKGINQKLQKM